ncbi:Lrp/AsnC family transcriptional regulator [Streptomyces sp. NPDC004069]
MQDSVTELDLALVNALQVRPRAPWVELGKVLDVDPVTVARRWERLSDAGMAWVTCSAGPAAVHGARIAYVEVDCLSRAVGEVTRELAHEPSVLSVHHLTGARSLLLAVAYQAPVALSQFVTDRLGGMDGITATRTHLVTEIYGEASLWRLQSLEPAQQRALLTTGQSTRQAGVAATELTADERRLIQILAADGRQTFATLAGRTGLSEATVRRRVNRLLAGQRAVLRCEVAQAASGWPYTAVLWADTPARRLEENGRSLAAIPEIRACAALSGPTNLLLFAWLRDIGDLYRLERLVNQRCPDVTVADRTLCLRTFKLLGRLLDEKGHSIGHIPIDPVSWHSSDTPDTAPMVSRSTQGG